MDEARRARAARVLVLGAGAAQLGLLEAARAQGLYVLAADADPQAPGLALADERAVVSSEDEAGIERLARARAVEGLISPGADWPVGIAARVAERLGLAHPLAGATAVLTTSKARQRERLASAGVPQPAVYRPDDPELVVPCVVKPPDRQGQRGLALVEHRDELGAAVDAAIAASRAGTAIVEEHVAGPEVTVNAVSVDGVYHPLTVTDRHTADPPAFGVALAHVWPSAHDTGAAVEVARAAVEALGIAQGPSYTQLRLGVDGPRVMEVAARLGGGHDAELCRAATGVDLNGLALSFALGERPPVPPPEPPASVGGACVLFLVAPEGELAAVEGVERAEALEGVVLVRIHRRPGWRFGPLRTGSDRAGAILAVGSSRDDALERARRAAETVRFDVDAHPS